MRLTGNLLLVSEWRPAGGQYVGQKSSSTPRTIRDVNLFYSQGLFYFQEFEVHDNFAADVKSGGGFVPICPAF